MRPGEVVLIGSLRALVLAAVLWGGAARGEVAFQWRVEFEDTKRKAATAHLWVPVEAERLRGVVVCGTTLMERQFVVDPAVRDACAAESLGVVIASCGLKRLPLEAVLAELGRCSGFEELAGAPLFFVGHSAGGPQANTLATGHAARCFGLVQFRGGFPNTDLELPAGVPALVMNGQFDEFGKVMRNAEGSENWERYVASMAAYRGLEGDRLAGMVVEPGAGHFAWSDRSAALAALFLRKAAAVQIGGAGEPLRRVAEPAGWLVPLAVDDASEAVAASGYAGEAAEASWFFDEELARAALAYQRGLKGVRDQFVEWGDGHWVESGARFFFTGVDWVGDGTRFEVHPEFGEVYPGQYKGRGPVWARAGEAAGNHGGEIGVRVLGGPLEVDGKHRLRVAYGPLAPAGGKVRGTFLAWVGAGDGFRYSERVGMMPRKWEGITEGADNVVTFPEIGDQVDGAVVRLGLESSAGVAVGAYVSYGPAVVEDGVLRVTGLPARARLPVEVEVVAWSLGRGLEPRVKTAVPVVRRFSVTGR